MPPIKNVPNWIWTTIVGIGTVAGAILGVLSVWNQIETNTQNAIERATILVTQEIRNQTETIAEFYEDDLYERIVILETEIEEFKEQGISVPIQKKIQLRSMQERLQEFKQR